ncbi:MAG: LamB/YcsF family protein [Chitinophagaceae bacterium]
MVIDINCDMGESYGAAIIGKDAELMPLVSSANIACGFHGGDPGILHQTIRLAQQNNVAIGAHPSYPDLAGFGRREMQLNPQETYDNVLYQLGALEAFTRAGGGKLHHVKPHGALYNRAARDAEQAEAILHAVYYFDKTLQVYGPADSELHKAALKIGLGFCREAFADRTYQANGSLTPRSQPGALIKDLVLAVQQVLQIIESGTVTAQDGTVIPMQADTICIHGDGIYALEFTNAIRSILTDKGIAIQAPPVFV